MVSSVFYGKMPKYNGRSHQLNAMARSMDVVTEALISAVFLGVFFPKKVSKSFYKLTKSYIAHRWKARYIIAVTNGNFLS